ncbi:MAG: hypothetical protein ABIH66_07075 [bacterium]
MERQTIVRGITVIKMVLLTVFIFVVYKPFDYVECATTWRKTFGGPGLDEASSVFHTSDGGYVVAGMSNSFGEGHGDLLVIKIDSLGELIWKHNYGGEKLEGAKSIIQTSDGGYLVAGFTWSYGEGAADFWIVKLDEAGKKIWDKTYGGNEPDWAMDIIETSDGEYILTGQTMSFGAISSDFLTIKLDRKGNMKWNLKSGGQGTDIPYAIIQTPDDGYIIVGETTDTTTDTGIDFDGTILLKIDHEGNEEWFKVYTEGKPRSAVATHDEAILVAGYTRQPESPFSEVYVSKFNFIGEKIWDRRYGAIGDDVAESITLSSDGGFIIAGSSRSYPDYAIDKKSDIWWGDVLVMKFGATGEMEWEKSFGGINEDLARSISQTTDGGYIVSGYTWSYGYGEEDFWVLKLDANGECEW